jgi:hypothetical protein
MRCPVNVLLNLLSPPLYNRQVNPSIRYDQNRLPKYARRGLVTARPSFLSQLWEKDKIGISGLLQILRFLTMTGDTFLNSEYLARETLVAWLRGCAPLCLAPPRVHQPTRFNVHGSISPSNTTTCLLADISLSLPGNAGRGAVRFDVPDLSRS